MLAPIHYGDELCFSPEFVDALTVHAFYSCIPDINKLLFLMRKHIIHNSPDRPWDEYDCRRKTSGLCGCQKCTGWAKTMTQLVYVRTLSNLH